MSDVGDLLERLHGARDRWTTVRCTVRHWHHLERGRVATERWLAASSTGSTTRYVRGDPVEEQRETVEHSERLWIAKPDRSRVESDHHVQAACGGTWWSWSTHSGYLTNEHDPEAGMSDPIQSYATHLDPAVLIPQLSVEAVAGHVATVLPRMNDGFHHPGLPGGADRHVLTLDPRGVVLRIESIVDGAPFLVSELVDPVFDEPIADERFTLPAPEGEVARSPRELHGHDLTLEEAAARVVFGVWAFGELPDGAWRARAHHTRAHGEVPDGVTIYYHRLDGRGALHLHQRAAARVDGAWARMYGAEEVVVERDGTRVAIQSEEYDADVLRSLAETLVRV